MATNVTTSTSVSPRPERSSARRLETSTIRMAVAISTPASAASGMRLTTRPSARTTPSRMAE